MGFVDAVVNNPGAVVLLAGLCRRINDGKNSIAFCRHGYRLVGFKQLVDREERGAGKIYKLSFVFLPINQRRRIFLELVKVELPVGFVFSVG